MIELFFIVTCSGSHFMQLFIGLIIGFVIIRIDYNIYIEIL
jgi:hypothetical protein